MRKAGLVILLTYLVSLAHASQHIATITSDTSPISAIAIAVILIIIVVIVLLRRQKRRFNE
ncbi:hypothetical protein SAMN05660206_102408 [Sphingobacterium wenxiniae]|uniref:LPXTG-motif cell wall anchor domain-containing protein n=1 Tax=Sphingobacterium wenxiniae TaxID=683125 RepID=A0A1I6QM38_9SPHI|nr:hypothetical protein SAMN05660206_102408 [Sphingobacterium wenxiniae]